MSFGELAIVLIVALIVLGPQRLPVVARAIGRLFAKAQHFTNQFQEEVDQYLKEEQLRDNINRAEEVDKLYEDKG